MKDLFLSDKTCDYIAELLKDSDSEQAHEYLRKLNQLKEQENASIYYEYFGGHRVSEYALKYGRLDYATMAKCFDAVLCNSMPEIDEMLFDNIESGDFHEYYYDGEQISRDEYEEAMDKLENDLDELWGDESEEAEQKRDALEAERDKYSESESDIYQYYIVSDNALYLLREADELVFYSEKLDVYVWAVCHWGTSWDYVLTSIKLDKKERGEE